MTEADNGEAFATRPAPVRFLLLLARYAIAILVSCVVSFATLLLGFLPLALVLAGTGSFAENGTVAGPFLKVVSFAAISLLFVAIGFCGVLSGTLCLPKLARRLGGAVLLFLGLAYGAFLIVVIGYPHGVEIFPFLWLIPLALGGILANVYQERSLHLIGGSFKGVFGWKRDTAAWPSDY